MARLSLRWTTVQPIVCFVLRTVICNIVLYIIIGTFLYCYWLCTKLHKFNLIQNQKWVKVLRYNCSCIFSLSFAGSLFENKVLISCYHLLNDITSGIQQVPWILFRPLYNFDTPVLYSIAFYWLQQMLQVWCNSTKINCYRSKVHSSLCPLSPCHSWTLSIAFCDAFR